MTEYLNNKTFDKIKVGDTASITRTLTKKDVELFAIMSGDYNPAHLDEEYAKTDKFHKIIGHGMWGGSMISAVLGTQLPGPGAIYVGQTLKFVKPVMIDDVITAKVTVIKKDEKTNKITLYCQCYNQKEEDVIVGEAEVIAPSKKVHTKKISIPELEYNTETCPYYKRLIQIVKTLEPIKVGVVHPVEPVSLMGAVDAANAGIIEPILIGPTAKIQNAAHIAGVDISRFHIIDSPHSHGAAELAAKIVREGLVETLMKGSLHTDEFMHAVIKKENGLRTDRRMSHVSMANIPNFPRPLFITDAAINIAPSLKDKKDITQNAIDLFHHLGLGIPKVAALSAVEIVEDTMQSSIDAAALAAMSHRNEIKHAIVDGPLSFDVAMSEESAMLKKVNSPVAGHADILVAPDIEAGNIMMKQLMVLSNAQVSGIVLGAKVPLILTSRSSDALERKMSCILALVTMRDHKFKTFP